METTAEQKTSHQLWEVVEYNHIFEPVKSVNNFEHGKWMLFESFQDDEDGTFPRVSDYMRIVNAMEREGATAFLRWIGRSKMKFNNGYCKVEREGKFSNEATIKFENPIAVSFGELDGEHITKEVTEIKGEFSFEWLWMKNGRQDKVANRVEVFFNCQEYKSK